jgi:hypothetical protein
LLSDQPDLYGDSYQPIATPETQIAGVCAVVTSDTEAASVLRIPGPAACAGTGRVGQAAEPHRCAEAILAPSAWDRNLAQVTLGTTTSIPATVPNPQSVPAITLSRPTTSA